jgi:exosortase
VMRAQGPNMTRRFHIPAFAFLCAVSILFGWPLLQTTVHLALTDDAYTHILLILPLSAGLIYLGAKYTHSESPAGDPRPSPRIGAPMLVAALAMVCYARWSMTGVHGDRWISIGMLALVVWWVASVILCFGIQTFRSVLFLLCFLFLIVPLPESTLDSIVGFLQYQSAVAARIMFHTGGVPVTQDGIILSIPGLDIEVARECSSIRSSLMLMVTTLVLAQLFLRSWWRKALLLAAAIPLSIAKNGFRIFVIAELGTRVDAGFLTGRLHHHGGIVFFGLAVVLECVLLFLLRRTELHLQEARTATT